MVLVTAAKDQPNILWIVSEDNSPLLGCYGDPLAKTPNIDRLAEKGVRFDNVYANAPVCAPSRSTIITGVYPVSIGTQHMRCLNQIPEAIQFFPNYLKEAGYFTTLRLKRDYNIPAQDGTWDIDNFWHLHPHPWCNLHVVANKKCCSVPKLQIL